MAVIFYRAGWKELRAALGTRRGVGLNLLSSALLAGNWLVYVWGVNSGHVIECSLGYFLVPLLNAALGRRVLGERLRPVQLVALGCATAGFVALLVQVGRLPWIALALAVTFGGYGLLRERSPPGPLTGLAVETALLAPAAAAVSALAAIHRRGRSRARERDSAHAVPQHRCRHRRAAAALRLRCPPDPARHPRSAPIHRADRPVRPRRRRVSRNLRPASRAGLRLHPGRPRPLYDR